GGREAVIDGGAAKPVAVGHLDPRHAGLVGCLGDRHHLLDGDLVALGMHAVAQAHFVKGSLASFDAHCRSPQPRAGRTKPPLAASSAKSSAVRRAAAVMMSRLPAYFGRKSPRPSTSR